MNHDPHPVIGPARYAKNMMAIHCPANGSGFKTRAARLASTLASARYSGRENAYIVSRAAAARFERLYAAECDACVITREILTPESIEREARRFDPVTEPTEQGNQYVIPGCEKDKRRGPEQADLF